MADWKQVFNEGIGLVLGRWSALRFAIDNALGGGDPHVKAQRLAENIYSWFIQSKNLDVYDLETLLDEAMDSSFQLIHQEGSVEEVAKVLMKLHEECLAGNFKSVKHLREASRNPVAHPPVVKVVNGGEDDEDSDSDESVNGGEDDEDSGSGESIIEDDNSANMDVDNSKSKSNMNSANKPVNGSQSKVNSDESIIEDDNAANMDVDNSKSKSNMDSVNNSKSESNMNSANKPVNGSQPKVNSDESIIEDDNAANMDVDNSKSESNMDSVNKPVNDSQPEVAGKEDDGWSGFKQEK